MQKLKTFWYVLKHSLTDPEYYSEILKTRFGFSLQYLFFLLFLTVFLHGILFTTTLTAYLPRLPKAVTEIKAGLREFYPNELVLTMKDGVLRTNVDEPYVVPFPKRMNAGDFLFAVIDTKSSVENIKKYKTAIYVTKDAIAYPDSSSSSGYKVQFFNDMKGYSVFNRQSYDKLLNRIEPYFQYVWVIVAVLVVFALILLPLVGSAFYLSSMLVYLVFLTAMVYIMARIMKKPLSFGELYRLGMHGVTFSLLFGVLKSLFALSIPFTFVMPYLIWMLIVLNSMKKTYGRVTPPVTTSK